MAAGAVVGATVAVGTGVKVAVGSGVGATRGAWTRTVHSETALSLPLAKVRFTRYSSVRPGAPGNGPASRARVSPCWARAVTERGSAEADAPRTLTSAIWNPGMIRPSASKERLTGEPWSTSIGPVPQAIS